MIGEIEMELETEIKTDNEENVKVRIESWQGDYCIRLEDFTAESVSFPLSVFDEVAAVVAKFRATNLILTGGEKSDE